MTKLDRMIRDVDWNLMRMFHVVVQEQAITRAAERLGLTQPAVSNALSRLERQLGRRLVERSPRDFRLTAEGELVAGAARRMMAAMEELPAGFAGLARSLFGTISLAFASHVASPFLDEVLSGFLLCHPMVTFDSRVMPSAAVLKAVESGKADLGVCLAPAVPAGLASQVLYREQFAFFCAEGHPAFGVADPDPALLAAGDYVSFPTDCIGGALEAVARLRETLGWHGRRVGDYAGVEDVRRIMKLARAIAPLPVHAVAADVASGLLWQVPPKAGLPLVDVLLVTRTSGPDRPAARSLRDTLGAAIAATPLSARTYPAGAASAIAETGEE